MFRCKVSPESYVWRWGPVRGAATGVRSEGRVLVPGSFPLCLCFLAVTERATLLHLLSTSCFSLGASQPRTEALETGSRLTCLPFGCGCWVQESSYKDHEGLSVLWPL